VDECKPLAWGGALLYVIERAAKFSLFKPAEEMVYITLNEESRTKARAYTRPLFSST
jgi:AAA family ATP:ADP antiporter